MAVPKYNNGFRKGKIEVLRRVGGHNNTYTLMCDCGFTFDKRISDSSGMPRGCHECDKTVDPRIGSANAYTESEEAMIAKYDKEHGNG